MLETLLPDKSFAIASVSANPKMATRDNFLSLKDQLKFHYYSVYCTKTVCIPTPAPAKPVVANPGSISFAGELIIKHNFFKCC